MYCRHLKKENDERVGFLSLFQTSFSGVRFLIPGMINCYDEDNVIVEHNLSSEMINNSTAEYLMMCAHIIGEDHWVLLVISLKWNVVWYLDSLRPSRKDNSLGARDYSKMIKLLDG